ncbi:energy transducer TonB [Pedobacter sp. SYSU D00535]|uniref:energy transducer TonB n=1 Tax=Pedobacter sp. SYSU D00535 TaxID=2810308 RepID=UPI001A958F8F|nr:energy transducer TonB [Pedobacter sp. SYSU D00535]
MMDKDQIGSEENESQTLVQKDRSLLYMGVVLGLIILVMGYLTLFVDDPWKIFKKEERPTTVVEDSSGSLLDESSSMSDVEVRTSLTKFIEAFYYDQRRGYFDPPSYFANITETFHNYHNLTHSRLRDIYWKRLEDMQNLRRVWVVSSLDFKREGEKLIATYWAKESYFRPSLRQQYSALVKYEMVINEQGKIISLKDVDVKNEEIFQVAPDTTAVEESPASPGSLEPSANDPQNTENKIFDASVVDVQPEFQGGQKELVRYISTNLRYPVAAKQNNIQGKVYVAFVVEKDGQITEVKVRQGIGSGADEEAVRLIRNSPKWKPGVLKGSPVRTYNVLPITFQLAQSEQNKK